MRYHRSRSRFAAGLVPSQPRPVTDLTRTGQPGVPLAQLHWRPAADVYETTNAIVITVELPGVDERAFTLFLYEEALVVDGQRRIRPEDEDATGVYHAAEIRQGPFRLELVFPAQVDGDRVNVRFDQRLLRIVLAKAGRA
jgi:HSP20 family protein